MQTLTREELSKLITGGVEMTEGDAENGEKIVTYKVLNTGETFVQLVKEHDCYQCKPEFVEELKADLESALSVSDLKAKLDAEKLKPKVDFKAMREAAVQAELAAAEAARIEAEKFVEIEDAVIVEEAKELAIEEVVVEPEIVAELAIEPEVVQ